MSEFITHHLSSLTVDPQTSVTHKPTAGSTFEEVLYGDDSNSEAEEVEEEENTGSHKKRGDVHGGPRLRIDNDQPMDLLESAVTQVTSKLNLWLPVRSNTCF